MGLGPIEEDVRFDHGAASRLKSLCNAAAGVIEGQVGSRSSWVSTARADFAGYYSELFARNQENAKLDADEVATRLRDVARQADELSEAARTEQQRREDAREWKREQEDRAWYEKGWDWLTDGNDAPVPDMPEPPNLAATAIPPKPRETPAPGSGGGGASMGTSSARPSDLRTFASGARGANQSLNGKPTSCRTTYDEFVSGCGWGSLSADSVFTGFDKLLEANEEDVRWVDAIADAFEQAGGSGAVSTLSNSALTAALQARDIDASRQDIQIDPPIAIGEPPTSGYADDPVNTATGNFVEPETDLAFAGGAASLALTRMYNSFDTGTGAFGPGWSSWTEAGLELTDESARLRLPDGRVIVFPRLGDAWDRATGESMWLTRTGSAGGDRLVASTNDGETWTCAPDGRLLAHSRGAGTTVRLGRDDEQRVVRLEHERGRHVDLTWDDDLGRVVAARGSDGRTVTYDYDEGRLVGVTTSLGTRSYRWNDAGLIESVVDADGVVELENTYDDQRRVTAQRSPHGRTSRFVYLAGNTTVVSDPDGTRSNTWISDQRGRLIGVVDSDENRQSFAYDSHGNRVMVTERDGSVTVREYDDRGRMVREVTPSGADITYAYDELDRVTTVVTESGAVTEYSYDGGHRNPSLLVDPEGGRTTFEWAGALLTAVTDPVGVRVEMAYDDFGDLVATTDALGNTVRLERDGHGRVTGAITPSGHRTTFTYAPSGLLASRRDPDGAVWHFEHTTAGRLSATTDPTGARTEIEHDDAGEQARTIDPLGRAVTRTFDDLGNVAAVELPDGTTWRFTHDAMSRLTATTTPDGATWAREYDERGILTATVDPTGGRTGIATDTTNTVTVDNGAAEQSVRFDTLGRPQVTHRPDGSTTMSTYDRCGRPVELLDAEGGLTRIERDRAGRPVTVTSPAGMVTSYEYDVCGRLSAVVDASGARTTREYDVDGRVVAVTLPTGEVARTEYDECGRVVSSRRPGRGVARYRYDAAGRVVESSDTWNGRRRFRYDAAGQLVEVVNGNGGVTRFEHDANGRPVAVTDPMGHVTRRAYDSMNRLTAETDPLGRTTRAGHDAAGRITWHEDSAGRRAEWTYDAAGRIASVSVDGVEQATTEHDVRARRATITDLSREGQPSTIELEWNRRGQLVRRSRDGRAVTWDHDADGRRTSLTTPDGSTTTYSYDRAGRLAAVDHPLLGRATFVRDAAGRLVEAVAGEVVQSWEHRDGQVVAHSVTTADGVTRTEVSRDEDGRITGLTSGDQHTTFDYDAACQLIEARTNGSVDRWRYDDSGRLVAETVDGLTVDHTYDAAGQLLSSTDSERTTRYSYDGIGRRVREESTDGHVRSLEWSRTGWLSSITDELPGGGTRRTDTHVDATGLLAEVDGTDIHWDAAAFAPTPVQAGDVPVLAAGAVTGVGGAWATPGWRTQRSTGADPWAATGGTGDLSALPGGISVGADGGLSVAGMEWLGARVYDPASRGFLSVDPLDPVAGAGWAGNPYSYAGNDPLHALDPQGLKPLTDAELRAHNAANNTGFAAAYDWAKDNWEYLAGGAMVIAGGALMFTGVGGPAGMMLISAGADTIIQKATTGSVRWDQVALSGALGAVPGAGGLAGRIPGVTSHVARTVVGAGITGAGTGAVSSVYGTATGPGPHTVSAYLSSAGQGALFGGVTSAGGSAIELGGIRHAFNSATRVDVPLDEAAYARTLLGNPGDTVVLGRQPDTAVANGWPGHSVLDDPNWSLNLNDEFVQGAMDYQRPIYLASEPAGNLIQEAGERAGQPTIFARELDQLSEAGYSRSGDYMVMP